MDNLKPCWIRQGLADQRELAIIDVDLASTHRKIDTNSNDPKLVITVLVNFPQTSKIGRELQRTGKKMLMLLWGILHPKPLAVQNVTTGRIEIERNGEVAYLEYSLSGNVLALIHPAIPKRLRGLGLASSLAETALNWAREKDLKVDIVCPSVEAYVVHHPEYSDLVMR